MFRHRGTPAGIGLAAGFGALGLATVLVTTPAIAQVGAGVGSFAEGRFLDGTLLGADLAGIISIDAATAENDGSAPAVEERNPLGVTALDEVRVAPGPIAVSDADGVDAGVLGQVAIARGDGTAYAASGLLGADGAIGVSPGSGATATIDLAALLGESLPPGISGLRLEAAGIAASAEATADGVRGDYTLADARLVADVPALAAAAHRDEAARALDPALAEIEDPAGPLAGVVQNALGGLGLAGVGAVDIDIDIAGLDDVLAGFEGAVLRDDALTIDLGAGTIAVDLARLPEGPGLNSQAPGTELLSGAVLSDVVAGAERLLGGLRDQLDLRVSDALRDAEISVRAHVSVLDEVPAGETVRTITTPITQILDTVTGQVLGTLDPATGEISSLVPGLSVDVLADLLLGTAPVGELLGLGGLLGGGSLPSVTTRVVAEASTITEPLFTTLETSADIAITGTLAGLSRGEVLGAVADAVVLGAPVALDASVIVDGLSDALAAVLEGGDIPGAPGGGDAPEGQENGDPADSLTALAGLVSLRTNVQSTDADGAFTQTALRAEVLGGDVATIDLANATVGPNAAGGPGDPGDPGDGGPTFAGEGSGQLAYTGLALGLIVLLGAAFVGLGGYALWRSRAIASAADAELGG